MDAFWARHVFNRTLRCAEAGCALALLDWPAANVGKETELAARPTCESYRLSDSGWDNRTALGYFRSDWRQSACADWAPGRLPGGKCEPRPPSEQPVWVAFKGTLSGATPFGLGATSCSSFVGRWKWAGERKIVILSPICLLSISLIQEASPFQHNVR